MRGGKSPAAAAGFPAAPCSIDMGIVHEVSHKRARPCGATRRRGRFTMFRCARLAGTVDRIVPWSPITTSWRAWRGATNGRSVLWRGATPPMRSVSRGASSAANRSPKTSCRTPCGGSGAPRRAGGRTRRSVPGFIGSSSISASTPSAVRPTCRSAPPAIRSTPRPTRSPRSKHASATAGSPPRSMPCRRASAPRSCSPIRKGSAMPRPRPCSTRRVSGVETLLVRAKRALRAALSE